MIVWRSDPAVVPRACHEQPEGWETRSDDRGSILQQTKELELDDINDTSHRVAENQPQDAKDDRYQW